MDKNKFSELSFEQQLVELKRTMAELEIKHEMLEADWKVVVPILFVMVAFLAVWLMVH